jgi:predicted RNA-binding protein associated with RNAse of E/G family
VDYAECKVDRKSTFKTCQFRVMSLVYWSFKKQNFVALSMAEAEYVTAKSCCAQLLCMRQTLKIYYFTMNQVSLLCDNESAIYIAYNSCEHSRTKHIDIRHQFLRDQVIKRDIVISHVRTNDHLTDIFAKPLDERRF